MFVNRRNSPVLYEIGVKEHDGDVRFQTGSRSNAVSLMRIMAESPKFSRLAGTLV